MHKITNLNKREGIFCLNVRESVYEQLTEIKASTGKSYSAIIADLLAGKCGGCTCHKL